MSEGYPELLVMDASVAAKWYVPEKLSERAAGVLEAGARGEARLSAPNLLGPELGNVLWHRQGDVSLERVREAWAAFGAAPLILVETRSLTLAALEGAVSCGCTVYDGLYVALTEAYGGEAAALLTADRKLAARLAGSPFAASVRALEEP